MVALRFVDFGRNERELILRTISFKKKELNNDNVLIGKPISFKKRKPGKLKVQATISFKNLIADSKNSDLEGKVSGTFSSPELVSYLSCSTPVGELDAAAIKVQKFYKSYRTRRNLADCAVIVEELWWKALDFAALNQSSVSFLDTLKSETVVSRWVRARTRAAKVGKGLLKDEKAQKLALRYWLEAIDPRHRYGLNLHFYYDVWFSSESFQPFFYWLDVGDGKEVNLDKCPRTNLQHQCIKYLGPKEREAYEVMMQSGKLVYRQSREFVDTIEGIEWIFVLSSSRKLYVGEKKKGFFQHSSFLAGGATISSGRLVANNGVLKAIWAYSGHYRPTEENFVEFCRFLEEHNVDLTDVTKEPIDDDIPPKAKVNNEALKSEAVKGTNTNIDIKDTTIANVDVQIFELEKPISCKWTTSVGPRIGYVRDYSAELQLQAFEQVNLSPRVKPGPLTSSGPVPSPRPSPKILISPRLAYMGIHNPG